MTDGFLQRLSDVIAAKKKNTASSYAFFRAAVLIPIVVRQGEPEILFEVRSRRLGWQPGDICFPGGKMDKADATPAAAAVRETIEELGVTDAQIKIIGEMDEIVSPIGVMLYPAVGVLDTTKLNLNQSEVSEVFTVPLKWLLAAKPREAVMEMGTRPLKDFPFELIANYPADWKGRTTYPVLFYEYGNYTIWGLTAHVLAKFLTMIACLK